MLKKEVKQSAMKTIGLLTSGGDCQGLNSTLRAVAKGLFAEYGGELRLYGFNDGYYGLMHGKYREMKSSDFSGILTVGGTILGASRQSFKRMRTIENGFDKVASMKEVYSRLGLDCLVVLGGNGSTKTANLLSQEGLNVISLPKTIDNDVYGTDMSFGFQSAVDIATNVLDCVHTTADSHGRVFIVELMGHKAGWLTLHAGIGGGADVILIPEIPYDTDSVCECIKHRAAEGKRFTIIAIAEGACPLECASSPRREKALSLIIEKHRGIGYYLESCLRERISQEIRVVVPGHVQRGGAPCPYDRVLTSRLGTYASRLIKNESYGLTVVLQNDRICAMPLSEVAGRLKTVPPDCDLLDTARSLGICLGE